MQSRSILEDRLKDSFTSHKKHDIKLENTTENVVIQIDNMNTLAFENEHEKTVEIKTEIILDIQELSATGSEKPLKNVLSLSKNNTESSKPNTIILPPKKCVSKAPQKLKDLRNKSPVGRPARTNNSEYTPKLSEVTNFCTVCAIEITDWNNHIKSIHSKIVTTPDGDITMACKECSYIGRNPYNINRHFGQHIMLMKAFKCRGCDRDTFSTFLQYKNHWYKAHTRPKFQCDECGIIFKTRYFFKNHFFNKHRDVMYCGHCYTIFEDPVEFAQHIKEFGKKKVKTYVCHICGQNIQKSLNEHIKYKQ